MPGAKPPPLQKRRRSSLPKVIIVAAILVVVIPVILFAVWRWNLSRDIDRLEAKARAAGEPITLQELAATRKPIPDDENAAVALMDIWQEEDPAFWKAFRAGEKKLPDRAKTSYAPNLPVLGANSRKFADLLPWSADQLVAARAFVATNQARQLRVHSALDRPRAQFQLNFVDGFNMVLPHLSALRQEAARLQLANLLAIAENRPELALNEIEEITKLSATIKEEPTLISQLVRVALINIAFTGGEQLLQHDVLQDTQLTKLSDTFRRLDLRMAFHEALLSEQANCASFFDKPINELDPQSKNDPDDEIMTNPLFRKISMNSSPMNAVGFFSLDHRLMLQTYDQLMELSRDGDWDKILKTGEAIRETTAKARKFPPKIITSLLVTSLDKVAEKIASVEARRRCALLAIEVIRFRQSPGGQLPENLDSIVAKNPDLQATDPFDGKQLRYRILNDGFVVYSVGPDRIDQKGVSKAPKNDRSAYDVAFTVAARLPDESNAKTSLR